MADYVNPMAGLPETNFQNNPFWSGVKSQERQQIMDPFLQMQKQKEMAAMRMQQLKDAEFSSPEAVESRRAGLLEGTAKSQFGREEALSKIRMLPTEEKSKLAELNDKLRTTEAKPYQEMLSNLAGLSEILDKAPPQHRPMIYKQWADRIQKQTGRPLDSRFAEYSDDVLNQARQIRYAMIYNPEFRQGELLQGQKDTAMMDRQREQSRSAANVAGINQRGALDRQREAATAGSPKTLAAALVQGRKKLADPNLSADEREVAMAEHAMNVEDAFNTSVSRDPELKALAERTAFPGQTGQRATEEYRRRISEKKRAYFKQNGIDLPSEQPQGGGGAPSQALAEALKKSGEAYQPDKFDYRVTADGRIQKKAK